jgi:hypothetical protein
MALNPTRQLTPAEKDRMVKDMIKSLPIIAAEDLFTSLVSEKDLLVKWDASQQAQIADIAARQLLVAKAVSEVAKKLKILSGQHESVIPPPPK